MEETVKERQPPRSTAEEVKQLAAGREVELLAEVGWIPADRLDGKHYACPFRGCPDGGGKDRFRLIDAETGAVFCNQCFAEANGDLLAAIQKARGVSLCVAVHGFSRVGAMELDAVADGR